MKGYYVVYQVIIPTDIEQSYINVLQSFKYTKVEDDKSAFNHAENAFNTIIAHNTKIYPEMNMRKYLAIGKIVMNDDKTREVIPWVIPPANDYNYELKVRSKIWNYVFNEYAVSMTSSYYRLVENPGDNDITLARKDSPVEGGKHKKKELNALAVKELQARCAKKHLVYKGLRKAELVALLSRR